MTAFFASNLCIIYRIQLSTSHSPPKPTSGVATDSIKICGKSGESSIPDVVDRYQQFIMYKIYQRTVYIIPICYNTIKKYFIGKTSYIQFDIDRSRKNCLIDLHTLLNIMQYCFFYLFFK